MNRLINRQALRIVKPNNSLNWQTGLTMGTSRLLATYQSGQAYAETLVGFSVIAFFLFGAHHLWRYAELQQVAVEAVRFAAWERVVWEPSDNEVEKFALHKTNEQLAKDTVLRQLSTPKAWRDFRAGLSDNGEPALSSAYDRRNLLSVAVKSFISPGVDPGNLISLTTSSGWPDEKEQKFRGIDFTGGKVTSLDLDKDTYRTVNLVLKSQLTPTAGARFFDFLLPAVETKKHLSLITNAWAASTPLVFIRTEKQLLPFSTGDERSGTKANNLAFFGFQPNAGSTDGTDFLGMVPIWNFIGGRTGFAGQFVVDQTGLDINGANSILETKGESWNWDFSNPASSLELMPQLQRPEYFQPDFVSNQTHKHINVISKTDEDAAEPGIKSRNSNIARRKYRMLSLQNPTETYFRR